MYTNAHSMGNKQEELEAVMKQENYDVVGITETWWDVSHDWSEPIDGYKLFRRDRQGRRGGAVGLYVRDCYDCFEHKCSEDSMECLCIRNRQKANWAYVVVGVYYRPPRQVDEIFYKHLGEISRSLALVLVGDFNFPDIC